MNKYLLRIIFLCIALLLSSKAFVALIGYQAVEALREDYGDRISVTYEWISSGFDGALIFENVVITPYSLKRPFRAAEVRIEFGHYASLLGHLADLKSLSLSGVTNIVVDGISAPLEGRNLEQWLADEYVPELAVPLGLYACGPVQRIGPEQWKALGIGSFRSTLNIGISDKALADEVGISMDLNLYELGRIELDLALGAISGVQDPAEWPFHHLRFKYVDNGYLRRIANMCESATSLDRNTYSGSAALEWAERMRQNGMLVNDSVLNAYFTYLSLGGALTLEWSPETPLTLARVFSSFDENLFDTYGMALHLNKVRIDAPELRLLKSHFQPEPLKQAAPVETEDTIDVAVPKTVVLPVEEVDGHLGQTLVVTLISGKVYEGTLKSSDEYRFELVPDVSKGAGKVAYTVEREDVKEILLRQR